MEEEHIEFNFIYSNDALRVKTFLGNVPRSIECINYMDIFNKLTKNDFYQYEPSDAVVSSSYITAFTCAPTAEFPPIKALNPVKLSLAYIPSGLIPMTDNFNPTNTKRIAHHKKNSFLNI